MTTLAHWQHFADRLRPFVGQRVAASDVDDVLQDVFVRVHRGIGDLRDDDRFVPWLFRVARNAIADHLRTRARHPACADAPELVAAPACDDEPAVLACCVAAFVARLPAPYEDAVRLVELEGLTVREAADTAGISESGMKSRVQRGRAQLRALFEDCCELSFDARGAVIDYARRCRPERT